MVKESYIKIGSNKFYRIRTGETVAINIETNSIKKLVSMPSGYMKDVIIIDKTEFEKELNKIKEGI